MSDAEVKQAYKDGYNAGYRDASDAETVKQRASWAIEVLRDQAVTELQAEISKLKVQISWLQFPDQGGH